MAISFSSYLQGPLGEAIRTPENFATLPAPGFNPSVQVLGPGAEKHEALGPPVLLLGPGDVVALAGGSVTRSEPAPGSVDVEPNYLACVELVPVELPWVLTPARPTNGRLRPWLVLVVLDADAATISPGHPLPFVDAPRDQLPDLADSWAWAHVQRSDGQPIVPGGPPIQPAVARLLCPRRLEPGKTYRACVVPAFDTGRRVGLGERIESTPEAPVDHAPAWTQATQSPVRLPVYHSWSFSTGPEGDFEELVARLQPVPRDAMTSSVRTVDLAQPWPDDHALAETPQLLGVQGALCPFTEPAPPEPAATDELKEELTQRLRTQLGKDPDGSSLTPPMYGGRHVLVDELDVGPPWVTQLNTSVPARIAAGLGGDYVREHQEELMARAWEQAGAIREANRRRNVVELTTAVAERLHDRHVASLGPGEALTFTAPAQRRTRTSDSTTLALELTMSKLPDGVASTAFARRVRPASKLARRTGATVSSVLPRGLNGEIGVVPGATVVPETPGFSADGVVEIMSQATAQQVMVMQGMAAVADVNGLAAGADLGAQLDGLGTDVRDLAMAGQTLMLSAAISDQLSDVTTLTAEVFAQLASDDTFGEIGTDGLPIEADQLSGRASASLEPGTSHWDRLASQTTIPSGWGPVTPGGSVMMCPEFPVPTGLALLESDPEWFLPGLGEFPNNRVALLTQNSAFIESFLTGMNHEMMRELLWREFPTDLRGTPFARFWPRPDGAADIAPLHTWTDGKPLGDRLTFDETLVVLLVRGDVVRRYPQMAVTAVPAIWAGNHPVPNADSAAKVPLFVMPVDAQTNAYAFDIAEAELRVRASGQNAGWFFVLAESGVRIRFGFDVTGNPQGELTDWNQAAWPHPDLGDDVDGTGTTVPLAGGHAVAGRPFGLVADGAPGWDRDAADMARIALQKPYRVSVQAEVLVEPDPA